MPSPLYREQVLAHNRDPQCRGHLVDATHSAHGVNPSCGDHYACELRVVDGRIEAYGFQGESCAVTTAVASMLGAMVVGRTASDLAELQERFEESLRDAPGAPVDPALGELEALLALRDYPARLRCAELPFATIAAALAGRGEASTESRSAATMP